MQSTLQAAQTWHGTNHVPLVMTEKCPSCPNNAMCSVGCSDLTQHEPNTKHVLMVSTNMSFMSWQCSLLLRLFRTELKLHHVTDFKQILCALTKWFAFLAICTWHNTCCTILLTTCMMKKTTKAAAQKLTAELVHISILLVTQTDPHQHSVSNHKQLLFTDLRTSAQWWTCMCVH